MKRRIQVTLPSGHPPIPVLDLLASRFTYQSREEWGALIAEQRVKVNEVAADAGRILTAGDRMEFIADDIPEPPVSFDIGIVHEDYDVMVINKPPNLPAHPAGRYFNNTLWAWLKTHRCIESPMLVNRLDRETSGLLLVAKTQQAEIHCRAQFAQRRVVKRYVALVEGEFPESFQARGWLVPDPESGVFKKRRFVASEEGSAVGVQGSGKKLVSGYSPKNPEPRTPNPDPSSDWAETDFFNIATRNGVSQVEALLHTGRLHQIRATLCSLGFPVVGDKVYGPDPMMFVRFCTDALTPEDRVRLRMDRQALHAMELEFQHPSTGETLHFEAPFPADMAAVLNQPAKR